MQRVNRREMSSVEPAQRCNGRGPRAAQCWRRPLRQVELAGGGLGVLELQPIEILRFTQGRLPGAICLVILRILGEDCLGARVQPQILHRLPQMLLESRELGFAFLPAGGNGGDRPGHSGGREARRQVRRTALRTKDKKIGHGGRLRRQRQPVKSGYLPDSLVTGSGYHAGSKLRDGGAQ